MRRLVLLASLVALLAVPARADVGVGHSGWTWGNPLPQGNTLRAVEFAGARGYAGGDFGTLLRTDDRGRTWTGIPTGTTARLSHIAVVDPSVAEIVSGCTVLRTDDGGSTFKRLTLAPDTGCDRGTVALSFPSANTGYLLMASGAVLRTTDAGASFAARGSLPADTPTDILFTDDNTGFATTRGSTGGHVYRTTDGGATWFERTTAPQGLNGLYFPDASVGYAVGSANTVLKTTDGGETWESKAVPGTVPASELVSIRCATTTSCLIATDSGERVLRTTNGGNAFTSFSPAAQKTFAVSFSNASTAVAVGEHGTTVLSTNADSGTPSYVPVADEPLTGSLGRLRATGSLLLAPLAGGKLARSEDGGRHWTTVQVPTSENLVDVSFPDPNNGYVLDAAGKVQRTADGGDGWGELETGTTARPKAIYAVDQNVIMLFGPKGVLRSSNGAQPAFEPVQDKVAARARLTDYDRTEGLALFAYGPRSLIVSIDLGLTWRRVPRPDPNVPLRKVDFLTGQEGFALLENGRVYRTLTGGRRWAELRATGARASGLSFTDARNGFLSAPRFRGVDAGWVLRTSDGGVTWRPQLVAAARLAPLGLLAGNADSAFALADGSDLFYTTSGGDLGSSRSNLKLAAARTSVSRPRRVKLAGRLSPAIEGATVIVSARNPRSNRWTLVGTPAVSATGTFKTSYRVRRTTEFVAQWRGDADNLGDGSRVITIVRR